MMLGRFKQHGMMVHTSSTMQVCIGVNSIRIAQHQSFIIHDYHTDQGCAGSVDILL